MENTETEMGMGMETTKRCETGTGTETTKRCGERLSLRVSNEPELAPHWVHSSIRKLIPGRHSRFVIVGPRVVVYRLSSSQVAKRQLTTG